MAGVTSQDFTTGAWPTPHPEECGHPTRELVRDMIVRMGDKWTMLVIGQLATGPARFGALMTAVPGVSHRMLTRTLRALQRDGMITRTAFAEVPPRVEYELTPLGHTLTGPVAAFVAWAEAHFDEVSANRAAFDQE